MSPGDTRSSRRPRFRAPSSASPIRVASSSVRAGASGGRDDDGAATVGDEAAVAHREGITHHARVQHLIARERLLLPRLGIEQGPLSRRDRYVRAYGLSPYDADVLTQRKDVADYFEAALADGAPAKEMANWVMTELLRIVREEKLDDALVIRDWPISAAQLAKLGEQIAAG